MGIIKAVFAWSSKPYNFYLVIALFAGILFSLIIPPFRGPDEASHVFRIYELSNVDFFLEKGNDGYGYNIPDALQRVNINSFADKEKGVIKRIQNSYENGRVQKSDGNSFQTFEGSGTYTPIAYAIYVPTAAFTRLMSNNFYIFFMVLRFSSMLACVILTFFAIRIIPFGKWFMVTIGLLPMAIHQTSVVSTDGLLIASVALFVASILYAKKNWQNINTKYKLALLCLLSLLSVVISAKPGYIPLLLLLFLLPSALFSNLKKYWLYIISIGVVAILSFASWYVLIYTVGQSGAMRTYFERVNHVQLESKKEIVKDSILNPLSISERFINTYVLQKQYTNELATFSNNAMPSFFFNNFVGNFGSLQIYPPSWISVTVILSLVLGYSLNRSRNTFSLTHKELALAAGSIVLSFALINLIFWLSWTAIGMPFIFGLQGRYIIPILFAIILFVPTKRIFNFTDKTIIKLLMIVVLINVSVSAATIFNYFYA